MTWILNTLKLISSLRILKLHHLDRRNFEGEFHIKIVFSTRFLLAYFLHYTLVRVISLTLRLLMSYIYIYIYGAPSKARNANVVYTWTYVWQR